MKLSAINSCDFYKVGHKFQYPKDTTKVYSNFTARSSKLANVLREEFDEKIVFFGLQGFLKWFMQECFNESFFKQPKDKVVKDYARRTGVDTTHIEALHTLGYLPLRIKALPEGSCVPIKVPVLTIENTLPEFFWLTNYVETVMSSEIWKSTTVATTAFQYKKLLSAYAKKTGTPEEFVMWQGHDFSMRGMSGVYDAAQSSAGHLLSFLGTDTIPAIDYLENYYSGEQTFIGGSVPASEHSVMSIGGKLNEVDTFSRLINDVYPTGVVSIVSDTYDFWNVITNTASALKEDILKRKPDALGLAKVVFRPDSGNPIDVICGCASIEEVPEGYDIKEWAAESLEESVRGETDHGEMGVADAVGYFRQNGVIYEVEVEFFWNRYDKQYYYIDEVTVAYCKPIELTALQKGAVECLWDIFGGTVTSTGHKLLNERVGLIYGDSITLERAKEILKKLEQKGFASGNIVFGIGSYTYQYSTRDSFGFAMKATYGVVAGESREIYKDPVTDIGGVKKSAKGLLRVEFESNTFVLYDQQTLEQSEQGVLREVFVDGEIKNELSLEDIRNTLSKSLTAT